MRWTRRDFDRFLLTGSASAAMASFLDVNGRSSASAQADDFLSTSFTIVALPDTQVYAERYPEHFHRQTEWIAAHRAELNIKFVMHLGDITEHNSRPEWSVARAAMSKLDGVVPYSLLLGNHDCGPNGRSTTRDTMLNEFFTVADAKKGKSLGGLMDPKRLDNSFHTFEAAGRAFLVLALEWAPRDEVVEWANDVLKQHADHLTILTTHAYTYCDNTRYDWKKFGKKQSWNPHWYQIANLTGGANDGEELWTKLVNDNPQVFMTLNGHVLYSGLGRLTSSNKAGKDVHQILVNYQMKKEGGQAYLRLIEIDPERKIIRCRSYSPSLDEYKTDPQNQFDLPLASCWG